MLLLLVAERMEEVLRRSEEVLLLRMAVAAVGALVSPLSRARRGARKRGWNIVCRFGGDVQWGLNWGEMARSISRSLLFFADRRWDLAGEVTCRMRPDGR